MNKTVLKGIARRPGVYKIFSQTEEGKLIAPSRGAKYAAIKSVPNGLKGSRKIKRHFETLREALAFRHETYKDDRKIGLSITFKELVDRWKADWLPNKERSTQVRYLLYLKHFNHFEKLPVAEITPLTIDSWIREIKRPEYLAQGHSTRLSYEHELTLLRTLLNYYVNRFDRNYRLPFISDHRKMVVVKRGEFVSKDLSLDELSKFLGCLRQNCWGTKWEPIYYLALMQYGIYGRIQETAALHCEDFDLTQNLLKIRRKLVWVRSKNKSSYIAQGTKTNQGREIGLSDIARKAFREHTLRSGVRSGLLFRIDGEFLTYRQIKHRYDRALKQAGLPFRGTHLLRHASLSEFYQSGRDILATQRVAGHTDIKTTSKYAKVRESKVLEIQHALDQRLNEALKI